jgi:glycosyltransferase involved in cell wall biosynthesis
MLSERGATLHIAISARAMSFPFGGVKEYVTSVIRELLGLNSAHRFTIYYDRPDLIGSNPSAQEIYLSAPHKLLWDHWALPQHLAQSNPDVVWFPHNVSSFGVRQPTVVSVMDMLYFPLPEFPYREYAWLDTRYMRALIPRSLRRADRVMAISNWTAHDITRLLNIQAEKIRTIYLAPGREFKPLAEPQARAVCETYGLQRPFFFYAGTLSQRKNVRTLIEAFGRAQRNLPHDLVITGGAWLIDIPFDDLLAKYGISGRLKRLGAVPKDDLVALYNAADAFIYPSLYEGFGIPPLEAFACGCPVVSSHATALAEVVGDAALTFAPLDVDALIYHLKAIAHDALLRKRLVRAGFERVQQFSYVRAAKELLALLEEAVS